MIFKKNIEENVIFGVYCNMKEIDTKSVDDDAILVERALAGERKAFDILTRRHLQYCYRIARRFGLSPEDAADIVQDTFLAAFRGLPTFNFRYKFSTWLTRIHLNRLSNFRRGLRRAKRFFWRPQDEPLKSEFFEDTKSLTPENELEKSELQKLLLQAISKLPERQRLVFILFEMEEFKTKEIADLLDIPEGTVTSRLHHARLALRKQLYDYL
ncbi:MAG: RNA polymerase sigma factor [bacterium]